MAVAMPQIKKIVMLMLENRSLDNVLGWLYEDQVLSPDQVFPPNSSLRFDGITPGDQNFVEWQGFAPAHGTQGWTQPLRQPRWNPNEWWENVGNQMYSDGYGHDTQTRWSAATPPMTGFAWDYAADYDAHGEVMGAFTKEQLPALYGLAEAFAVSDRWFSSVPTETNPNRAFSLCGSSLGAVDNSDATYYDLPTIFNVLTSGPAPTKSWGIYYQYNGCFDMDPTPNGQCFTADIFPHIRRAVDQGQGVVDTYDAFLKTLTSPDLPDFSYIEPFWGGGYGSPFGDDFLGLQGNDYHAPAWVGPGEYDLNELYNALRNSPYWDNMLFIITFDEHGGTWDHVPPPIAVKPDISPSLRPFDFRRMGARVPTLLVSPWVRPGTVFRAPAGSMYDFDHTSFIATILRWAGIDPRLADMGLRVANAPTFDGVLSTTNYDNSPTFDVPEEYANQGGKKGPHNIPHDICKLSIHTVRRLLDESATADDLVERLRLELARAEPSPSRRPASDG